MNGIALVNLASVGIFGMVLSAAFCGINWTWQKRIVIAASMAGILVFQGIIYFFVNSEIIVEIYPFITHIPLVVTICAISRKYLWSVVSVLAAYLCCQIRRWLALLAVAAFSGDVMMQNATELLITFPLLWILIKFIAPSVRSISYYAILRQCQFGLVPALYYGFDYITRIYTNWLSQSVEAAVEFMPFVCSIAYLIFVSYTSEAERVRSQLEQTQKSLNLQLAQVVREIEALRESQEKTRIYRHDLRHHIQYISSCIENGRLEQAQNYMREIYSDVEGSQATAFCENETVNLIFSSFAGRARDDRISVKIDVKIPKMISVSESDFCVLLSNGLENALHACQKLKNRGLHAMIEVSAFETKGKLFLQIINSCEEDVHFENEIPVTDLPGHGMGVRSICAIVERYSGIYAFSVKDGRFILRVSL
ncbi:MAG: GHKL domain-containing protein [Lachnospiraceae bacterium]|nr:GHKL domain-containing protein [Lachnospiraceae bacterium]